MTEAAGGWYVRRRAAGSRQGECKGACTANSRRIHLGSAVRWSAYVAPELHHAALGCRQTFTLPPAMHPLIAAPQNATLRDNVLLGGSFNKQR